jgi:hypothetical protein
VFVLIIWVFTVYNLGEFTSPHALTEFAEGMSSESSVPCAFVQRDYGEVECELVKGMAVCWVVPLMRRLQGEAAHRGQTTNRPMPLTAGQQAT